MTHPEGDRAINTQSLLVIGGGIAGTMAVIAAGGRGLEVVWVADRISPDDQSAHWHGHLHRGRLYDPDREGALIEELSQNAGFWWSDGVRPHHTSIPTIAVGPDLQWAESFRQRLTASSWRGFPTDFLRAESVVVETDEAILDGPALLDAAHRAAARIATRMVGRCDSLRRRRDGSWSAEVSTADGEQIEVTAGGVILATGAAVPDLIPDGVDLDFPFGARLSRMLVLRGELPRVAAIVPSRAAGGLFFAPRDTPGEPNSRRTTWLVSDGFSSPGAQSPSHLTGGWWTCSVIERLQRYIRDDVLEDVTVGGYLATKFRLASSPAQVPARGVSVDVQRSFAALAPSKWSTSPSSSASAIDALIPDPLCRRTPPGDGRAHRCRTNRTDRAHSGDLADADKMGPDLVTHNAQP